MYKIKKEIEEKYGFGDISIIEDKLVSELASCINKDILTELYEMDKIEKERISKLKSNREEKINKLLNDEGENENN